MKQKNKRKHYLSDNERKAMSVFLSRLTNENIVLLSTILFGSKVRGDYDAESDIDLLLVLPDVDNELRDHVRDISADVSVDYSTYLSTRVWSEAYFHEQARAKTALFQEIQEDGIELLPMVV